MRPIPLSRRKALFHAHPDQLIRLYTKQHKTAWQNAQTLGYFSGDHGVFDIDDDTGVDYTYHKPYDWMRDQMAKLIPDFSGERPVWAYPKRPVTHKGWHKLKDDMILFTALVPRKRILFSDYEPWHMALNDWLMCDTEQEDDEWYAMNPRPDPSYSWVKCLDICQDEKAKKYEYYAPTDLTQSCVDRIYLNEIVSVKYPKM